MLKAFSDASCRDLSDDAFGRLVLARWCLLLVCLKGDRITLRSHDEICPPERVEWLKQQLPKIAVLQDKVTTSTLDPSHSTDDPNGH